MSQWPHLEYAPIVEALIDIRVRLPDGATLERLEPVRDILIKSYPEVRTRRRWQTSFTFHERTAATMQADVGSPDGFLLSSSDKLRIVQVRLDGFTFSRLKPYETWERLREEARRTWDVYRSVAQPVEVTRIAVRYINRLELPLPFEDFREWILTVPEIAPGLPQQLAGYFFRVNLPFPIDQGHAFVNITQKIDPQPTESVVPMIFDIDAFNPDSFVPTDEKIWDRFEELREAKNAVFFKSITEKTLTRYKK